MYATNNHRSNVLDFATRKKRNCTNSVSCGNSCISKTRTCRKKLKGKAKEASNWLEKKSQVADTSNKKASSKTGKTKNKASSAPNSNDEKKKSPIPRMNVERKAMFNALSDSAKGVVIDMKRNSAITDIKAADVDPENLNRIQSFRRGGFLKNSEGEKVANELESLGLATVARNDKGKVTSFTVDKNIGRLTTQGEGRKRNTGAIPSRAKDRRELLNSFSDDTRSAILKASNGMPSLGIVGAKVVPGETNIVRSETKRGFRKGSNGIKIAEELEAANLATVTRNDKDRITSFELIKGIEKLVR